MENSSSSKVLKNLAGAVISKINFRTNTPSAHEKYRKEIELIRSSEYFDSDWYLVAYPDVANEGFDPALHYLLHGGPEGRDPGPHFSSASYLSTHKGELEGSANPLVHFLETGGQLPVATEAAEANEEEISYIRNSKYFDETWYKNSYGNKIKNDMDAAAHYYLYGSTEKLDPSPQFSTEFYLRAYETVASSGLNALVHYEKYGKEAKLQVEPARDKSALAQIERFYRETRGLQVFEISHTDACINLVTDSISSGSLFGGVGTALIFGALLAHRLKRQLRIVTRQQAPDRIAVRALLRLHGVEADIDVSFTYVPVDDQFAFLSASKDDIYITTSWWTTRSTLHTIESKNIIYILQEDEQMFYSFGMNRLLASEIMKNKDINIVINSQLMYRHLVHEAIIDEGENVQYFEPAFPEKLYFPEKKPTDGKLNFGFYARPHNDRNLYIRGLEALDEACASGVIDARRFNVIFFGKDLEPLALGGKIWPRLVQNVAWQEYGTLVRSFDLCLSLMYTPHPSYPPLDVAASGGVVVTNRFGLKDGPSLARYSANILASDLDKHALVETLRIGVDLAGQREKRLENYNKNNIERVWDKTLKSTIDNLAQRFK